MAIVQDSLTAVDTYTPWDGPTDAQRAWSAIPRGVRRYTINAGALTLKPVNDQYELLVGMTINPTFAHIITGLWATIDQDVALNYDTGYIEVVNGVPLPFNGFKLSLPTPVTTSHEVPGAEEYAIFTFADEARYRSPFWMPSGLAPVVTWKVGNRQDEVGAAGELMFLCEMAVFDLSQALNFPLNYSLPVNVR